jgi:predicted site-specific integrase-resolvase
MPETNSRVVEPVFDTTSAAPLLGVKPGTLEVWRCKGIGPKFVKSGSRVIYRLSDINQYLESRTRTSTADPGPCL